MNKHDKILWVPDLANNFNSLIAQSLPEDIVDIMADMGQCMALQIKQEATKASTTELRSLLSVLNKDKSSGLYQTAQGDTFISHATFDYMSKVFTQATFQPNSLYNEIVKQSAFLAVDNAKDYAQHKHQMNPL
tara:strand:+ start:640039 stop:640437 length:399 start_codon:yes stop_codon:yes gene_type:complete